MRTAAAVSHACMSPLYFASANLAGSSAGFKSLSHAGLMICAVPAPGQICCYSDLQQSPCPDKPVTTV